MANDPITAHGKDPLGAYYFHVEVDGGGDIKARFTEVSGIKADVEEHEIKEGGLNDRTHKYPGRITWGPITLKKGMGDEKFFWDWWNKMVTSSKRTDKTKNLTIVLYDRTGSKAVRRWHVEKAWPKSWEAPTLNAGASEIAIESLTLNHEGITEST